jgi:hypothetical protein
VASFVGLVNGYADLGTWFRFSPFIGAGIGFADNRASSFADRGFGCANASKTSFAFALMAGVDFDVAPDLKIELGYRYLNSGAITTGGLNCLAGESGGTLSADNCRGVTKTISSRNRLASNDLRLGLLYLIGEAPPPPTVAKNKFRPPLQIRAGERRARRADCLLRRLGLCRPGLFVLWLALPAPPSPGQSRKAPEAAEY